MGLFEFNELELMTFFMVLVRFSVLVMLMPILGDKMVPAPIKILMSLSISVVLFPVLLSRGLINPADAAVWGNSATMLIITAVQEIVFALALAFVTRLVFEAIQIGGNLAGTFMGFASASMFDPNQETQTQIIAKFQYTIALLIFLTINGHHILLRAISESYKFVGIGKITFQGSSFFERVISLSGEVIRIGLQIAAPMALSIFAVHVVYAVMAKAMPQLNVLVLSFSVSALIGLVVLFVSTPEFHSVVVHLFEGLGNRMGFAMLALSGK